MPPAIPDYQLLRAIGRGAYGEVWLARSVTGVFRAAKIVYRASFEEARPFEREFAGIQRFEPVSRSQENQISILHVGRNETEGYFYYVMELADDAAGVEAPPLANPPLDPGRYVPKTLKEVIARRGRLTAAECLPVAAGLCRALGHLHQHGLIHRDVKPSNIIFVNGHPKLADIGLVSSVDATRSFVGTEGYVPREGPGTPTADLYSLGKVLYETVTGRPRQDFPLLPQSLAELPDRTALLELNEIILKACAEEPSRRYRSAEEMRSDLLLVQAGKSLRRLHAMERRFKRVVPAVAACALAALGIILVQHFETLRARDRARVEAQYRKQAEEQERKTRELLYVSDMNLVQQAYDSGDFGRAEEVLKAHLPQSSSPDLRGFEWWYFWRAIQGEQERLLIVHSNAVRHIEFSPDGRSFLSASYDGSVQLWDWNGSNRLASIKNSAAVRRACFSHDGLRIVFHDERRKVECRNIADGRRVFGLDDGCLQITPSPTEPVIAVSCQDRRKDDPQSANLVTRLLDDRTGEELRLLPDGGTVLRFSPDGKRLAVGSTTGRVNIWSLTKPRILASFNAVEERFDVCFSPEGRFLAVGDGVGNLSIWDIDRQLLCRRLSTPQDSIWQVAFSPDGQFLATAGSDQTVRFWDPQTLQQLRVLRGHRAEVWTLAFSPDGSHLVTGGKDQTIRIWSLAPTTRQEPLTRDVAFWQWPVFSPDSRFLAAGDHQGVGVWRLEDQAQVFWAAGSIRPLGFTDQGQSLWVLGPRNLQLHSLETSNVCQSITAPDGSLANIHAHAFRARDQLLALGRKDGQISLWDLASKTLLRSWKAHSGNITALAFSIRGDYLVSTCEQEWDAKLWRAATGDQVHTFKGHKLGIFGAAFSTDGILLATVSPDDTCRLWNADTFEPVAVLGRHRGGAFSVCFGKDGRTLAVGEGDHRVKLWSLTTFRELATIETDPVAVFSAAFSPNGQFLETVGYNGGKGQCSLRLLRAGR